MSLRINAGSLDRRVQIQTFTVVQAASGQEAKTWAAFKTVWARRMDVAGRERFTSAQRFAVRTARFRMRWHAGLGEEMRLIDDNVTFQIDGIAGDKREGWMELTCSVINPPDVAATA